MKKKYQAFYTQIIISIEYNKLQVPVSIGFIDYPHCYESD